LIEHKCSSPRSLDSLVLEHDRAAVSPLELHAAELSEEEQGGRIERLELRLGFREDTAIDRLGRHR